MTEGIVVNYGFVGNLIIRGKIVAETGLLIGGSEEMTEIGGIDKQVIRDADGMPYIPGSSLKGKMRSLLEWYYKKVGESGIHVCKDVNEALKCPVCRVFGVPADQEMKIGPTRLICRDGHVTERTREELRRMGALEVKTENVIERLTSKSKNLRTFERVPKGSEFNMELVYSVYNLNGDSETDKKFVEVVFQGMELLRDSYIGGSGSRGYGKISFRDITCTWKTAKDYEENKEGKSISLGETLAIDEVRKLIGSP
ncbi:MAG: type III-A CRISPR-associated RAMP protein Csm3 [Methanomassiliicoccales archaeon]|nr:type III-A CRISPR-associated RAMP protein Csm3 [Methanomassiliicoccales archaeon]